MQSLMEAISSAEPESLVFIDGSYFCFYRYHSMLKWWKFAHPETPLDDPFVNPVFMQTFKKTFAQTIHDMCKHLKLHTEKTVMLVGKDCKREDIWRHELYPNYKGTRPKDDGFMGGPFFKMVYEDRLFQEMGIMAILKHPKLEADDCIAISVLHALEALPNVNIHIITSDKDYLQLAGPRVNIWNLSYKNIAEQTLGGSAEADLFCKIVMGDISDNITSVLKKCGPKTALKCHQDRVYFEERMKKEDAYSKYDLNRSIIDFNRIPAHLIDEFMTQDSSVVL